MCYLVTCFGMVAVRIISGLVSSWLVALKFKTLHCCADDCIYSRTACTLKIQASITDKRSWDWEEDASLSLISPSFIEDKRSDMIGTPIFFFLCSGFLHRWAMRYHLLRVCPAMHNMFCNCRQGFFMTRVIFPHRLIEVLAAKSFQLNILRSDNWVASRTISVSSKWHCPASQAKFHAFERYMYHDHTLIWRFDHLFCASHKYFCCVILLHRF